MTISCARSKSHAVKDVHHASDDNRPLGIMWLDDEGVITCIVGNDLETSVRASLYALDKKRASDGKAVDAI